MILGQAPESSARLPRYSLSELWADALTAAACIALAPAEQGGARVHSLAGPVRDQWLAFYKDCAIGSLKKIPCQIEDDRLLGGIDLASTLSKGKPVSQKGVIADADNGTLIIAMAERMPIGTATRIAHAQDAGQVDVARDGMRIHYPSRFAVIALDESIGADEMIPQCLLERLPVMLFLNSLTLRDLPEIESHSLKASEIFDLPKSRSIYSAIVPSDEDIEALCAASLALGIGSLRVPIQALHLSRAHAALHFRLSITPEDLSFAVRIVMGPRATQITASEPDQAPPQPSEPNAEDQSQQPELENKDASRDADGVDSADDLDQPSPEQIGELQERIVQAALASIPTNLLASIKLGNNQRKAQQAGTSGEQQRGGARGRATGIFRKKPSPESRIHLLHTLRASIPWQKLRQATPTKGAHNGKVQIRKDDFRYQRIEQKARSTIIFAIDASGSAALHRLAEAKGAIELLLAQCYVRRDQVAVIAFKGKTAQVILPPTRSLARAKRSLAGLPGGGGTPLAAALDEVTIQCKAILRKGETPFVVMLTDGRANVARKENAGRTQAQLDADLAAKAFCALHAAAIVLDTSPQPHALAQSLARNMGALYMALPYAGSASISTAVQSAYRQAQ
jgi:magnesium chelatase subunit D